MRPLRDCPDCGKPVQPISAKCPWCGRAFSHRDCYPEQYQHPLVGKRVRVSTRKGHEEEGVVERVVSTRFGLLAHLEGGGDTARAVRDCTPLT
jgi:hypothetical protein